MLTETLLVTIFLSSFSRGALVEGAFGVEFGCGARGRASHARTREVGGHRPGPLRGSAARVRLDWDR
jgi:hypothetical protein